MAGVTRGNAEQKDSEIMLSCIAQDGKFKTVLERYFALESKILSISNVMEAGMKLF